MGLASLIGVPSKHRPLLINSQRSKLEGVLIKCTPVGLLAQRDVRFSLSRKLVNLTYVKLT